MPKAKAKSDKTSQLVADLEALIAEAVAAAADGQVTLGEALAILGAAVKLVSHIGKRKS